MPLEIERKFLVRGDAWREVIVTQTHIRQGYIAKNGRATVRVRCCKTGATLTVKGARHGLARSEFEHAIPVAEGEHMLRRFCTGPLIEKVRYDVVFGGMLWQIDEYLGEATDLIIAEIELAHRRQIFRRPSWVGAEVTHDLRFRNSAVAAGLWRTAAEYLSSEVVVDTYPQQVGVHAGVGGEGGIAVGGGG